MSRTGPIGIFVHHQGRGHAMRAAALANALGDLEGDCRPVTLFSARADIFPPLRDHVTVCAIPSLFEPAGGEPPRMASLRTPDALHCAPVGWAQITDATATLAQWFRDAQPALFVTDVSAELGLFARICSIPHVAVLQHGDRSDPGHITAYQGAAGLLAPFSPLLEQADRPAALRDKTHYAPGIGVDLATLPAKADARAALGVAPGCDLVLVLAGGGGQGTPTAPLTLGARAMPESRWVVIGETFSEWHETPPGNLELKGWVDNAPVWIAAADRIVSSCGNTTVHQVAATDAPWIAIPEWRYFGEQYAKAQALGDARLAATQPVWPAQAADWAHLWEVAQNCDFTARRTLVSDHAARDAARWLNDLANGLWEGARTDRAQRVPTMEQSA